MSNVNSRRRRQEDALAEIEPLIDRSESDHDGAEEEEEEEEEEAEHATHRSSSRRLLLMIAPALIISSFVGSFDLSYFMNNYTRIASNLDSLKDAVWTVLAGSISAAIIQPIYSYFSAIYGRSAAILIAYFVFGIGTFLCGISPALWTLAISRIFVGLGTSAGSLLTIVIVNDLAPLDQVAIWRGGFTAFDTIASMIGGPAGSGIAKALGWRWTFFFETIATAAALIILFGSLRALRSALKGTVKETLLHPKSHHTGRINAIGGVLLVTTVTVPLCALALGDSVIPWDHPAEITLFAFTPVLIAGLFYHEKFIARNPIIPVDLVSKLPVVKVLLGVFGVVFSFNAVLFNLPLYMQVRALDGTTFTDYALTCVYVGVPLGALFGGFVIKQTHQNRWTMVANALLSGLLYILFATGAIQPERAKSAPALALLGFTTGIWQSCLFVALLAVVERAYQPQLIAIYDLVLFVGGDLVIALSSSMSRSLFIKRVQNALGKSENTEKIVKSILKNLDNARNYDQDTRNIILSCFESSIRSAFILSCVATAIVFITAWFITESDSTLDKQQDSDLEEEEEDAGNGDA